MVCLPMNAAQDPDAILHYIDTHGEQGEWVVQKYIERPFLIHGRKFDIRTWVVVGTRYDVWLWQEVRFGCMDP